MNLSPIRIAGAACVALLLSGAGARADFIPWEYTWSSHPGLVSADSGTGGINFLPGSSAGQILNGTKDLLAATLQSTGPTDATYTNAGYSLTMTIHDDNSKAVGSLTFSGVLNGTYNSGGGILNKFTDPISQQLTLGGNVYTVTVGSFSGPGAPGAGLNGRIGADVTIAGGGAPQTVPEPAGLTLAVLGLSALVARHCWKRRVRMAVSGSAA